MASTPSSRVIVKNLPKWSTEERVRKHFGSRGQISDIKLMYTRNGTFRRFAYIGFASVDEAASAVRYFDKTFMDTAKIQVEFAQRAGSEDLSRPWSKYSMGSSAHQKYLDDKRGKEKNLAAFSKSSQSAFDPLKAEVERKKRLLESIYGEGDDADSQLKEFMAAAKPSSKTKLWENDAPNPVGTELAARKRRKAPSKIEAAVELVSNKKPGGQGLQVAKTHVKFTDINNEHGSDSDDLYEDLAPAAAKNTVDDNSDESLLRGPEPEDNLVSTLPAGRQAITPPPSQSAITPELTPDLIAETGRLFVRNLSYSCSEADLTDLFGAFGPLSEVHLSISRESKKSKGFAYILFMFPEHALRAYSELDGTIFLGRILHILPAYEALAKNDAQDSTQSGSFQKQKQDGLKSNAQKDYNWNSLFLRSDTVLEAVAAKLGVKKASIMDVHNSENLATRMAVAETNLIHETKVYLEAEGVVLDAFNSADGHMSRSDCVILVKNLPFETGSDELRRMFEKFGTIGRVVLPPTKAIAIVEFFHANEARSAFRSLAYSKFKHVPLFLEWAPVQALTVPKSNALQPEPVKVVRVDEAISEISHDTGEGEVDHSVAEGAPTLYVKNLNFTTTSDTLKTVFLSVGPVRSVRIVSKKATDGTKLSLGFGFVEFERKESLNKALDELQGHVVDGHALLLKRSTNNKSSDHLTLSKKSSSADLDDKLNENCTKLLVRNIPFEASEKEVRELFQTFAQLKRLRLPRKFDGRHRGFGFVDFLTHQEAVNAKQALTHTHLYGRHMVIEWAHGEGGGIGQHEDGADIQSLRH